MGANTAHMLPRTELNFSEIPRARDEFTPTEFDMMIAKGLAQAKAGESRPAEEVLHELRSAVHTWR